MNFTILIKKVFKKYSEKEAILEGGDCVTYKNLWEKINSVCQLYQDLDVKRGDRIMIVLPNSAHFLFYHFAAMKMGAISVPVKIDYKNVELSTILRNCQPKILVSCDSWLNENNHILKELKSKVKAISVDNNSLKDGKKETEICQVRNNEIASINYSCFEDGYPKGACLTHGNHIYAAVGYVKHLEFRSTDRFLVILPMPHVFTLSGCINSSLIIGGTIIVSSNYIPKLIFLDIKKYKITILTTVPAVFEYLARFKRKERNDLSSLRLCVTGGDFMPEMLQREYEMRLKKPIVQGYGLTESLPIICNVPGPRNKPGTLGVPGRRDIKIKIMNEKNEEMSTDQIGEILIKSPTTMAGYYGLPEDTKRILKDGWLYTGDFGKVDRDGVLHFCGLKKKIFNIYGNKVDPIEVKNVLLEHPSVEKVNIYLEKFTEDEYIIGSKRICADIYLRNNQDISSSEIRNFCRERIAAYKIPEKFFFYTI